MSRIVIVSGSPSNPSTTDKFARIVAERFSNRGHIVEVLVLRDLPPAPLLAGDKDEPTIARAVNSLCAADAVVIATPVFKATYSGLLKVFVDLLPMGIFSDVPVLPFVIGGSKAHVLALDYGVKPLLSILGASTIGSGRFVLSSEVKDAVAPDIDGSAGGQEAFAAIDLFERDLCLIARGHS
ncbi:NAD(P)H-dependent oxidoreductase [Auritidibacter sp. NML100628]|uniref:NAD(P)H-dependent oxidoreductase n=1 Tax=Auritidibacter sp. NML100628 TaxID=2170742 RepID=UPI001313FAAF|nr:NAD(P)H-dependent oxidoreductase [Auritidibacter sp. NML100628]